MRRMDLEIKRMELDQSAATKQAELDHSTAANLDKSKVELAKTTITDQTKREVAQQEVDLAREIDAAGRSEQAPSLIRDEFTTPGTP